MKTIFFAIYILLLISINSLAQDSEISGGKLSGYFFGDYYYFIDHHNSDLIDQNGFQFRRIYFTYDYQFDENFSTRLRLEFANAFNSDKAEEINAVVKDAFLAYKFSKHKLILGISSPPTFVLIEKIWGYRSVEKTPLDLQKFASSRDFGLAIKGDIDNNGIIKYHAMFGNGSSNKNEIDKGKAIMAAIAVYPVKQFVVELYGNYTGKDGNNDWYTLQGFAGYNSEYWRAGIQFARQTRMVEAGDDLNLSIASLFLINNVTENFSLFGRVDRQFDPNPDGEKIDYIPFDKNSRSTLFIGGVDWHPMKNISFIPNMEIVKYDKNSSGTTPKTDIIARLTFYWKLI